MLTKIILTIIITIFVVGAPFMGALKPSFRAGTRPAPTWDVLAPKAAIRFQYQTVLAKAVHGLKKSRRAVRGDAEKLTILGAGDKGIAYAMAAAADYQEVVLIAENAEQIKHARTMLKNRNVQIYDFDCDLDKICADTDTTIVTISPETEEEARELYLKATQRTRNDGSICIAAPVPENWALLSCEYIHSQEKTIIGVDDDIVLPTVNSAGENEEPDVFVEKEKPGVEPDTKAQYEVEAGDLYMANEVRPEVRPDEEYDGETYQAPYLLEQADKGAGTPAKWGVRTMKVPTAAPPGGMVVEIISSSVCGTDLGQVRGDRDSGEHAYGILGHEAVGIIRYIDEEANDYIRPENGQEPFKVGDTVILDPNVPERPGRECATCLKGASLMCPERTARSHHTPGLLERFAIVHPREVQNIIKVSPDINPDHAAMNEPIACAYYSLRESVRQLEDNGKPKKLVIWGSGFQGIMHAILAALVDDVFYDEIIIIGRNSEKNKKARQILSQLKTNSKIEVVDNHGLEAEEIDKITSGADTTVLAFSPRPEEAVDVYTAALHRTADGGVLNLYGVIKNAPHVIPAQDIYERGVTVLGNSGAPMDVAQDTAKLIENGDLPVDLLNSLITHRFTLDEMKKATSDEIVKEALKIIILANFSAEKAGELLDELFEDTEDWKTEDDWTVARLSERLRDIDIDGSRRAERLVLGNIFANIEAGNDSINVFTSIARFYRRKLLAFQRITAEERFRLVQHVIVSEPQPHEVVRNCVSARGVVEALGRMFPDLEPDLGQVLRQTAP